MKASDSILSKWMRKRMASIHHGRREYGVGRGDVTILAYFFIADMASDNEECAFGDVECAIRETWLRCGMMKTVIVVNRCIKCVERFAEGFSSLVQIQVEKTLIPGSIYTMSVDCNSRLHRRFDTPNVLIVQNDGFPLRSGLDEFVGESDFIGAPYVRDKWWLRCICHALGCWVSNGGFSLRSHEICELASFYWNKKYQTWPDCDDVSEDYFYTKTLPIRESSFRRKIKIANTRRGLDFSYDAIVPYFRSTLPFGFHNQKSFAVLMEKFSEKII